MVAGADLRLEPLRLKAVDLDIRPRISLRIHHRKQKAVYNCNPVATLPDGSPTESIG
jgi:hypothetical protein